MMYEIKMPRLHREHREEALGHRVWLLMDFGNLATKGDENYFHLSFCYHMPGAFQ